MDSRVEAIRDRLYKATAEIDSGAGYPPIIRLETYEKHVGLLLEKYDTLSVMNCRQARAIREVEDQLQTIREVLRP